MTGAIENASIRTGESAAIHGPAESKLAEAKRLSDEISGNLTELNRWMAIASPTKTWMQALYFSVECMRRRQNGEATSDMDGVLI
jgi:hypothetical protein